jgi:hypothetical protein
MLTPLQLTAWGLVVLGGLLLLLVLGRAITVVWQRLQPLNVWARYSEESSPFRRRRRSWGWVGTLTLLLLGLLLAGAGGGLLALQGAMQVYAPLALDTVAARVQCASAEQAGGGPVSCVLALNGATGPFTTTVQGVRWAIEGEALVWDEGLERFGLRSGYRLVRLVTYDAAGRATIDRSLPAAEGGLGDLFSWLDGRFSFVQALKEKADGEVTAGALYELTISRSGFTLQKLEPAQP